MRRTGISAQIQAAAERATQLHDEATARWADSGRRKQHRSVLTLDEEMAVIARELFELDAVFAAWDGTTPAPEKLVVRIFLIEDRLAKVERRLRTRRPSSLPTGTA